ncbi:hypothetical protein ABFX02_08G190600 [Erythranthe guttata]
MLSCPLKLSASRFPINSVPRRTVLPKFVFVYAIEHAAHSTCGGASLATKICPFIGLGHPRLVSSFTGPYSSRAMHKCFYPREKTVPRVVESSCRGDFVNSDVSEEPNLTENTQADSSRHILEGVDTKEIQRRKKIGKGNKGKIPWNIGRKHSEETRERISRRTKEALKDPKIRKKMSEAPRTLSNQTKSKIRASLTRVWGKRLRLKRTSEKFMQSWKESIAKAAKIGGTDQQKLDWDSYEKIKREIALQQIHQVAEKAKAKEMARVQAERAAQERAEKTAILAQKRREREEKAKNGGEPITRRNRKSKEEKEKLAEFQEEKLKERLMKIRKKKSAINQVSNQSDRPWERFDLDIAKGEQLQKEIPLADQIRFAKNKRAEQIT